MTIATEISFRANAGGQSLTLNVSATSQYTAAIAKNSIKLTTNVDVFYREGSNNPVAVAAVDDHIPPGIYRIEITEGKQLAFATAGGTGTVRITPGA